MTDSSSLIGQFLIAMPNMQDPRFARAVVYICAHNEDGAMGLVINRLFEPLVFSELMKQLDIYLGDDFDEVPVHFGGPVEAGRGFVLHTDDYETEGTVQVAEGVRLSATVEILKDLAMHKGPQKCLLMLGYAGWSAGQLEAELQANGWLHAPADLGLLFDPRLDDKWERVLASLGINPAMLSSEAGHA